jgi:hypothetical protein
MSSGWDLLEAQVIRGNGEGGVILERERSEEMPMLSASYHVPPLNPLSFQQDSRIRRISTFVFIDIPESFPGYPKWPFVFIDIPGSFVQF